MNLYIFYLIIILDNWVDRIGSDSDLYWIINLKLHVVFGAWIIHNNCIRKIRICQFSQAIAWQTFSFRRQTDKTNFVFISVFVSPVHLNGHIGIEFGFESHRLYLPNRKCWFMMWCTYTQTHAYQLPSLEPSMQEKQPPTRMCNVRNITADDFCHYCVIFLQLKRQYYVLLKGLRKVYEYVVLNYSRGFNVNRFIMNKPHRFD